MKKKRLYGPLEMALREAVVQHYQHDLADDLVEIPIGEAVSALVFFAVEIAMAIPRGPHRENTIKHIRDMISASEISIESGKSIGTIMAEARGERLN